MILNPTIEKIIPRTVLALPFVSSKNGIYELLLSGAKSITTNDRGSHHFANLVNDLKPLSLANKSPIPRGIEYRENNKIGFTITKA